MVRPLDKLDISLILSIAKGYNDEGYAKFICQFPMSFYLDRVKRINFSGYEKVLDIGCGYGQWTSVLAMYNQKVIALECNQNRLSIAQEFIKNCEIQNVDFVLGDAISLPLDDLEVDAIFCYGVFMFLDRQKALKEFHRVLKPGGKIYICTNAFGWWLRMWLQNIFGDKNLRSAAYRAMTQGRKNVIPNSTNKKDVFRLLNSDDWEDVLVEYEGHLFNEIEAKPLNCYQGTFLNFDAVIEFTSKKKAIKTIDEKANREHKISPNNVVNIFKNTVLETLTKTNYEYITPLTKYPQPKPSLDLVNNCYASIIEVKTSLSLSLNRLEQLQWLYARITESSQSDLEKFYACLTFAQLHFFHHFAGQPMQTNGVSVLDPIAGILLGFGRCGTVSRLLVDLFLCNGFQSRLVTAGCHTSSEVFLGGKWVLADASLFPPGIYPMDDSGDPVSLEQIAECPALIDKCPSYINYHHEYIDAFLKTYPETDGIIGKYLRNPLLPSSGYFAKEYFTGGRAIGLIERLSKTGSFQEWNADVNFGWTRNYEKDVLQGQILTTRQRPSQVQDIYLVGEYITWNKSFSIQHDTEIVYRLVVSDTSRKWAYDSIPIGFNLSVIGEVIKTQDNHISIKNLLCLGRYLTIYAEINSWQEEDIFYLPSKEFDLRFLVN